MSNKSPILKLSVSDSGQNKAKINNVIKRLSHIQVQLKEVGMSNELYNEVTELLGNAKEKLANHVFKSEFDCKVKSFLIKKGYTGLPVTKAHYSGNESCFKAYEKHQLDGYVILAQQFSDCFAYRIQYQLCNIS